jgi:hypothetical protein
MISIIYGLYYIQFRPCPTIETGFIYTLQWVRSPANIDPINRGVASVSGRQVNPVAPRCSLGKDAEKSGGIPPTVE